MRQGSGQIFGEVVAGVVPGWVSPNVVSGLRLALGGVAVWLGMGPPRVQWLVVVVALGLASDYLDGALARARAQQTRAGAYLDPLADKLLVVGCVWALWRWGIVGGAMVGGMVAVEAHAFVLPPLHLALRAVRGLKLWPLPVVRPRLWGKYKTGLVGGGLMGMMVGRGWGVGWLGEVGRVVAWGGIGIGAVACVIYVRDWWQWYLREPEREGS